MRSGSQPGKETLVLTDGANVRVFCPCWESYVGREKKIATCFECVTGLVLPFILTHFENCLSADGLKYMICKGSCPVYYGAYSPSILMMEGTAVAQWSRCCTTNRSVTGSIPAGVTGIFH